MANKLKIRKGDTVKVLSGKDKGKTGKVLNVDPIRRTVVVENVNIHTRFERSKRAGQPGSKVQFPGALAVSKVQLIDSNSGSPTRVGFKVLENGTRQRIGKDSGKAV
jgi:large subunit ribosomal protein L24